VSSTSSGQPQITWPKDVELTGCNPNTHPNAFPAGYNYPTWVSSECSILGRSYSDMLFTVNSQCKKIIRTWKVLNWCTTGNSMQMYSYNQIIKIISDDVPKPNCRPEIIANSYNCKNADVSVDPLIIDPSTCGGNFEITNNSPYAIAKGSNISGIYPVGTTKVTYTIKYGCGNIKLCHTNVVVKNASTPTPYCIASLVTTLMPVDTDNDNKIDNGMVSIWAKDFDLGSKSACGYYPLTFSFAQDSIVMNRKFTCDNVGLNEIPIYITDSKGGQTSCTPKLTIQNNGANIPDCHPAPPPPTPVNYAVVGHVLSVSDAPLKKAELTLTWGNPQVNYTITYDTTKVLKLDSFYNQSGHKLYRFVDDLVIVQYKDSTITNVSLQKLTDENGDFEFDSLSRRGEKLSIKAMYKDEARKGIDHKDVELLTKYLLGEVIFTSYHQYLAADIDENGVIDIQDQNALIAFVTNTVDTLPGKNQWYILPSTTTFNPAKDVLTKPLEYEVKLDSLRKDSNFVYFVGIKKGNVSVDPGTTVAYRTQNTLNAYPNPFGDMITFSFDNKLPSIKEGNLKLYSISGELLTDKKIDISVGSNEVKIQSKNLISGLILYQLTVGESLYKGRLIHVE
jgi:hypothetical protein